MKYYLGLDIGGTKVSFTLSGFEKNSGISIIKKVKKPTPLGCSQSTIVEFIVDGIREIIASSCYTISAVGISCGGPIDSKNGIILNPPNLYGWNSLPIVQIIFDQFGIPAYLQNDANACALAEWVFGAGKGVENLIFLTMGTGMGAGLILNGRLYSGTNDMAGEIGHMRLSSYGPVGYGKVGSFEGFCSGNGIAQLAQSYALSALQQGKTTQYCSSLDKLRTITACSVAEAARDGDEMAIKTYQTVGKNLGKALSVMVDFLNPELIIIGSIFERDSKLMSESMTQEMHKESLERNMSVCRVVPSQLRDSLGDFAATTIALYAEGVLF